MTDALFIAGMLCSIVVVSEWLVRRTALRHAGTALLVILITAVASNVGLIPAGSSEEAPVPIYDGVFSYLAPLAIFWLLLTVNLREVLHAGLPMITLFLIGAAGVVAGAFLAIALFDGLRAVGPFAPALAGMFVATYTGGSINFNAIALNYGVVRDGRLYAGTVVVDNVVTTVWMIATLALPRLLLPLWSRRAEVPVRQHAATYDTASAETESLAPHAVALMLGLGVSTLFFSGFIADLVERAGVTIPTILILTTIALLLAQIPAIARLPGARVLGMFTVYIFLAVIGAFCDLRRLVELGRLGVILLGFAGVLVIVHGAVTFGVARLLRMDLAMAAIASQANVGGATTALALARSLGRDDLVLPAVLIGSFGTAIGTFLGFAVVHQLL
jgi:uncharacterized membrane protein